MVGGRGARTVPVGMASPLACPLSDHNCGLLKPITSRPTATNKHSAAGRLVALLCCSCPLPQSDRPVKLQEVQFTSRRNRGHETKPGLPLGQHWLGQCPMAGEQTADISSSIDGTGTLSPQSGSTWKRVTGLRAPGPCYTKQSIKKDRWQLISKRIRGSPS